LRNGFPHPIPVDVARWDHQALREYAVKRWGPDFTLAALALHFGIAESFTRSLLQGRRQPSLHTYGAMLANAGLPVGAFMRGLERTPPRHR